jgi:hypothetical protein
MGERRCVVFYHIETASVRRVKPEKYDAPVTCGCTGLHPHFPGLQGKLVEEADTAGFRILQFAMMLYVSPDSADYNSVLDGESLTARSSTVEAIRRASPSTRDTGVFVSPDGKRFSVMCAPPDGHCWQGHPDARSIAERVQETYEGWRHLHVADAWHAIGYRLREWSRGQRVVMIAHNSQRFNENGTCVRWCLYGVCCLSLTRVFIDTISLSLFSPLP